MVLFHINNYIFCLTLVCLVLEKPYTLDKIVHDAHRIELNGESMRKVKGKQKEIETLN